MATSRFSPVHYETLEAEAAARKLAKAIKRRRNQGSPAQDEFGINAYNIARTLKSLQTAIADLSEEYSTLGPGLANIPSEGLAVACGHIEAAIQALPQQAPPRTDG